MSSLLKWNKATPITIEHRMKPVLGLHKSVNEAFNDFYNLFETGDFALDRFDNINLLPALDIVETDDYYTIEAEMPGMGEEDIKITINEDRVTIKGEKSTSKKHKNKSYLSREITYGRYDRTIALPPSADSHKATATFKKGMLWINIPKKAENKNHSREVKIGKS